MDYDEWAGVVYLLSSLFFCMSFLLYGPAKNGLQHLHDARSLREIPDSMVRGRSEKEVNLLSERGRSLLIVLKSAFAAPSQLSSFIRSSFAAKFEERERRTREGDRRHARRR
jgi:hypothetical protein